MVMKAGRQPASRLSIRHAALAVLVSIAACISAGAISHPFVRLASAEPSPENAATAGGENNPAAEAAAKKKRYRRSKLTYDESEGSSDHRYLRLTTGEDKAVDLDFEANLDAKGISIGNPTTLTTTLVKIGEKRQIVFKPLKAGETNVTIRDVDGNMRLIFSIRVTGSNLLRVSGEVRNLLRDIEGIDIRVVGQKVVIEGEVLVPADYGRVMAVVTDKTYADTILNLVTLSPLALQVLAKRMAEDINTFAPNVRTRVVNGLIFLEGQADSQELANRAFKIARLYLPEDKPLPQIEKADNSTLVQRREMIQTFILVNPPPPKKTAKLVRITVHYVELSKDYLKAFGFKWQPGFTSDPQIAIGQNTAGGAGATGASFSATLSSLIPRLDSLQKSGYARILKTGTVVVKSGDPANLVEKTDLPFAVQAGNGQVAASTAKVGIELAVTPQILGQSEDISMELKLSQSNLVGRNPSGQAPTTSEHKVETKLYVKSGESAAVAGVTSADVGTDFNKDDPNPGAFADGGTAPLFTLMRTKNYHKKKSQFVIFVTPQIIENASEGTDDLKKNFRVKVK
jgi:pilus assembly protein CpaC